SAANRNRLGAEIPFSEILNSAPPLKTVPVGEPETAVDGTEITSGTACPRPSSKSETPLPLLANQNGPVGLEEIPQGFTRFGSVMRANPGMSEVRLTWTNAVDRRYRSSRHSTRSR